LRFELKGTEIYEDNSKCCDIEYTKKEIIVNGKYPYQFTIKPGFSGYKIFQNNKNIGKGKGFELNLISFTLKPELKSDQIMNILLSGKEIRIMDQNNFIIGYIKFENNTFTSSFSSPYDIAGVIYLAYLSATMHRSLETINREGKVPERPIATVIGNGRSNIVNTLIMILPILIAIFIAPYSVLTSYIFLFLAFILDAFFMGIRRNVSYIAFYNDHMDVINSGRKKASKISISYSDIKNIEIGKNKKSKVIIILSKPILGSNDKDNTIILRKDPYVDNNTKLSEFLKNKIDQINIKSTL
jgi:hypothetical protein